MSLCPICEREHQPNESPTSTTLSNETNRKLPVVHGVQTAGPRNRWAANARCHLPEHVLKSRVLIVDHNAINQKLMERNFEKFGLCSNTVSTPEETLAAYQDFPMTYRIIVMDPMPFLSRTGFDASRQIRDFERANNVPPCCIIASDGARSIAINRNGLRQKVIDSGVDCVLPWYRNTMPLYDTLASVKEREQWDRLDVVTDKGTGASTMRQES